MQTQPIRAKFNRGVFEPLEEINLPEGFDVMVHLEELNSVPELKGEAKLKPLSALRRIMQIKGHGSRESSSTIDPSVGEKHSFELLSQLNFKSEVKDGSANLDKYIYDNL